MSDTLSFWNIRGLSRLRGRLKKLLKKFKANVFAIVKPFLTEECMYVLRIFLYLNNNYHCSNELQCGKLWLFWNDPNIYEVLKFSNQSISRWVVLDGQKIMVTFVYAKCSYVERGALWQEMDSSAEQPKFLSNLLSFSIPTSLLIFLVGLDLLVDVSVFIS